MITSLISFYKEVSGTRAIEVLILNEKISISSEQLEELQWNFQERRDLILKVTKKQGFTLSLEYTNLEQVTTTVKIWSERNLSKISDFSILGTGQSFCLSSFLSFLNNKLQQLSKLEVRERFPRYPSFLFWVQGKIEDSETLRIFYFSSKSIPWLLSFCLSQFFVVFAT